MGGNIILEKNRPIAPDGSRDSYICAVGSPIHLLHLILTKFIVHFE